MVKKILIKPEWWAISISAVSLILSGIIAYFSFFQPPKLEIVSFMPFLLNQCDKPSKQNCRLGGVLEISNASNSMLSVKEMSISGKYQRLFNPYNKNGPVATEFISIIGSGLGDCVLQPHSTSLMRFEFIDFSNEFYLQYSNVPHKEIVEFLESNKPIKIGRTSLNFDQLYMKHHVLTGQTPPATCFQMPFFDNILYYLE